MIALVVGLHFVPLARIFGTPAYYLTATGIVLTTGAAFAIPTVAHRQAVLCSGCGLTLRATAAWLLRVG